MRQRVEVRAAAKTGYSEAFLQEPGQQARPYVGVQGHAAWSFVEHCAHLCGSKPAHPADSASRSSATFCAASTRMFRMRADGGSGAPAASKSPRTARGKHAATRSESAEASSA